MRIISGKYKGRRISTPHKIKARPTTDFAKEGLFNLLNNRIDFEDIDVLDLFAGTGSIGFEFVSRGCKQVVAIENHAMQCNFIRKVCTELGVTNLLLFKTDVFRFLKSNSQHFDFIFADPPYELTNLATLPDLIFEGKFLKPDGTFVLEHSSKHDFAHHPAFSDHRAYGNVHFTFFTQPA